MDDLIKLSVYGITYSQVKDGVYALLLAEENGRRRIPVIVGVAEAQSIAAYLERVQPSRPLTHDLFVSFSHAFGVQLDKVLIYKFENGVFYSELSFSNDEMQVKIDSRTSDAIAIAVRTNSPIYATQQVVEETGLILGDDKEHIVAYEPKPREVSLDRYTIATLEKMMGRAAEEEKYERAAEIKAVIEKKRASQNLSDKE